ncbi:type II RES/Xre toxin-antitoxin system antitoxin [Thiomonas sp.]
METMHSYALAETSAHSRLDIAECIEAGLPYSAIAETKRELRLTDQDLAEVLDVSTKTLQRLGRQRDARLSLTVGDRLYRLSRVASFAVEVFGDQGRAREWLREPQFGLGMRAPLHLVRTDAGTQEVWDLLGRIQYGVYS